MKADDTASKVPAGRKTANCSSWPSKVYQYRKVLDGRKTPIAGLYQRIGVYFARLTTIDPVTGRKIRKWYRLTCRDGDVERDIDTLADARKALERVRTQRDDQSLPVQHRTPKFAEYAPGYLEAIRGTKRERTVKCEASHLNGWLEHFGPEVRLDKITTPMVRDYMSKRLAGGWNPRSVNLAVVVLRNVLKRAMEDGWLHRLATANVKSLKYAPKRKELTTAAEIDRLCQAALDAPERKNGRQFADYIRFLQFSGARCAEALRVRWADVDFERRQLVIGSDGLTKSGKARVVDFNHQLEAHLRDMQARRAPDSVWLFPSPQRGDQDTPAKTFVETLRLVRNAAGLPHVGFHHLRHYFISAAVMAGIDFMTIAAWVGHQDGGILIGKVYGHLADAHKRRMAGKLIFGPVAMEEEAGA